ncbi:MAG: ATP-binding protein, partial [Desulfobacterales bacterium]
VLINLLSNAIQATAPNGRVTVALKPAADGVLITVSDTGSGIAPEHLDKIFEPFFSTKPQGEGTGLGLFVTREIVEKMGGSVRVDSRLGHGSRFVVQIPNSRSIE